MWRDERSIFNQQIYLLYWGNWRRGRPSMAGNLLKRHLKLLECDRIWEKPVYFVSTHFRLKIIAVLWKKTKDIARLDSCLSFTPTIRADEKTSFQSTISSASFYTLSGWSLRSRGFHFRNNFRTALSSIGHTQQNSWSQKSKKYYECNKWTMIIG